MPVLKIQHSFQGSSGTAEDQYVNTFHLLVGSVEEDSFADVNIAIKRFYSTNMGGASQPVFFYMSPGADDPGARVKIYDLSDAIPRTPLFDEMYTPTDMGGGGDPIPEEIACCLSYAGAPASGIPMASTRGRIYIGPLSSNALDESTSPIASRPALAFRTALVNAGKRLANELASIDPVSLWVVHSVTHNHNAGIVRWWSDDAWDVQRRRGAAPTSRATATL